jgi:hypothetical protein
VIDHGAAAPYRFIDLATERTNHRACQTIHTIADAA